MTDVRIEDILAFWFGDVRDEPAYYEERVPMWFGHDPQLDQEIRARFFSDYRRAAERQLPEWPRTPRGGLALVLLLDQFPRNMFRGQPRAFATDPLALETAECLIHQRFDRQLLPAERQFVYFPFMHSENLEHQQRSVTLFTTLAQERPWLDARSYAVGHREIIARFGRFPHRNATLGRVSTPEEIEFLRQPGSSF
ncbi:MAG: DUF924 family protein [Thermodesulfobacteriota bacterium]|jgi:uncharacterized protein (DUF924 family)